MGWTPESFLDSLVRVPFVVALKGGAKGCSLIQGDQRIDIDPFTVDVADTVGAGDAFAAGLIAGILKGMDLASLGRMANAVAALSCRGRGPLEGQPTRGEVEALVLGEDDGKQR